MGDSDFDAVFDDNYDPFANLYCDEGDLPAVEEIDLDDIREVEEDIVPGENGEYPSAQDLQPLRHSLAQFDAAPLLSVPFGEFNTTLNWHEARIEVLQSEVNRLTVVADNAKRQRDTMETRVQLLEADQADALKIFKSINEDLADMRANLYTAVHRMISIEAALERFPPDRQAKRRRKNDKEYESE